MPELRGIVPRPARVAKVGRCAEGPSVKTMLYDVESAVATSRDMIECGNSDHPKHSHNAKARNGEQSVSRRRRAPNYDSRGECLDPPEPMLALMFSAASKFAPPRVVGRVVRLCIGHESPLVESYNGRFLRHRFSPKPKVIATPNSLPKRNHVAKEAVSAAWQTKTRQRSERICKPNDCSNDEAAALRKNHVVGP